MSLLEPIRIGLLFDYIGEAREGLTEDYPDVMDTLRMVADEYRQAGKLDRPVEFVLRKVNGLPRGSFRAVQEAFHELVQENCLVIYGPWVSENGAPLREDVEALARVPIITMGATESMLGEWVFGLPNGSLEEEPIIMAQVAWYDGVRSVGLAYEDSLIGEQCVRSARAACKEIGIEVTGEVTLSQVDADQLEAMKVLAVGKPDAILSVGFGLGNIGINDALEKLGWAPRRYANTSFNFGANNPWWRKQLAGWVGIDSFDERNPVGQAFLDRFEARYGRRPAYFFPLYAYDVGRLMMQAVSTARPLTGRGVKEALERIKMMPAASGAPGTRMRFGKFIRHGWMGTEFLVARRYLPDGSRGVIHGTIEGLVAPVE
jgi:ABC-type branched-subunit amino acid transport system substrate-binding protein